MTAGTGETILATGLSGSNLESIATSQAFGSPATTSVSLTTAADAIALLAVPILSN